MKSSRAARGCVRVRGAVVFASLLCSISPPVMAQAPSPAPAQPESREAWRESMARAPLPKEGMLQGFVPEHRLAGGSMYDPAVTSLAADARRRVKSEHRGRRWHQRLRGPGVGLNLHGGRLVHERDPRDYRDGNRPEYG